MSAQPSPKGPKGAAQALILIGALLAVAGSLASILTGDHRLMLIASTGFAVQFLGWTHHRRRTGGA